MQAIVAWTSCKYCCDLCPLSFFLLCCSHMVTHRLQDLRPWVQARWLHLYKVQCQTSLLQCRPSSTACHQDSRLLHANLQCASGLSMPCSSFSRPRLVVGSSRSAANNRVCPCLLYLSAGLQCGTQSTPSPVAPSYPPVGLTGRCRMACATHHVESHTGECCWVRLYATCLRGPILLRA
jgi:hypothetical protein